MRKLTIGAISIGVLLVMGAFRVLDLRAARTDALAAAEARADNLALILSEYINESFQGADAALRQLTLHSQRVGGPSAPAAEWTPSLLSARAGLTGVGAITILDRDGTIRHSTRPELVGQTRRDEYVTRVGLSATEDQLIVGTPFPTLSAPGTPSQLIIPIGRPLLPARGGAAQGTVVASFRPEAPRNLLRQVNVGAGGLLTVFHQEGVVLFREPGDGAAMGQPAAGQPLFAAARGARGFVEGPIEDGGPVLLTAFRTTETPPLLVAISMDRDEVLAPWRDQVVDSLAVFGTVAAVLGGVLFVLFRQMDERTAVERDGNARIAAALERERAARAEAEAASALKDEFLMTVSHELRTPLTAIYGWARILNQGGVSGRQQALALKTIERNAEAQTRLIDDLLDVSKVISGKLHVDVRPVAPQEVLEAACATAGPAAAAKSIHINATIDGAVTAFAGDPARLQQIVWNLLANAIKFTPTGGHVRVAVTREADRGVITVADDGIGMSPEFLPHVFDRFRQEESGTRRRYGGLGLGLAIVRSLVELHGGTIEAHSDGPDRGARFTVRLPLAAAPPGAIAGAPPAAAGAVSLRGRRALVVDDDPEARELFRLVLERAGAHVDTAGSVGEALARLAATAYDALVSDIEMPGGDGWQLGEQAAALAAEGRLPVAAVAVSAYARPEDAERSRRAGYRHHLGKPVDPGALVAAISACFAPADRTPPARPGEASR